jgi:aflatoxin B1 aldehyde reductase
MMLDVLPSVYQGNYNAFARTYEATLLPLLHSLKISFYAYSPQAGGFLAKTADLVNAGSGRFNAAQGGMEGMIAQMYTVLYKKPALMEGLTKWNSIATEAGIRPGDMALRWVKYNSALKSEYDDALIVGPGRSLETCEQTLKAVNAGPLSDKIVEQINEVWEMVKDDAPVDNYHSFIVAMNQPEPEK